MSLFAPKHNAMCLSFLKYKKLLTQIELAFINISFGIVEFWIFGYQI